jgi:hypothetical protein
MDKVGYTSGVIRRCLPFVASIVAGIGCFLWLTARAYPEFAYMKTNSIVMVLVSFLLAFVDMLGEPLVDQSAVMWRLSHILGIAFCTALFIMCIVIDGPIHFKAMGVVILVGYIGILLGLIYESRKKWTSPISTSE